MKSGDDKPPPVFDPFSRLGDEIAGTTANEVAINLGRVVQLSSRARLQHEPPNLYKLFKGYRLSEPAKAALRLAHAVFDQQQHGQR